MRCSRTEVPSLHRHYPASLVLRRQAYCGDGCRKRAQLQQHRNANRKHQDSPEGRLDHRDRQRAYRERLRRRVTDATSPGMNAGAIIDQGALRKRRFLAVRN